MCHPLSNMSSEGKSKDSDKSKAREAFANLVANLWNEERTSYEESYELEDADDIPMEQLEEHNYKDLRVMDLYFSPDDSDTDSDSKGSGKNDKGTIYDEDHLMKMTKDQLFVLLASHGKRVNNKKILKGNLVKLIIREGFNKPHDE